MAKTVYTIGYTHGSATVSVEITAEAEVYSGAAVEAPQNIYQYNKIEAIEAPRLFDTALLYIYASEAASSTINQTLFCQAAGYTRTEQTQMHYTGVGVNHQSSVTQNVTAIDNTGAVETYTATEEFRDGQYTRADNGGAATPDASVNANAMLTYLQGYCSDNIPALNYIASAKLENVSGLYRLELELSPKWSKYMSQNICYQLFQDADFLDNLATDNETTAAKHYMFLDPFTGFPLSVGTTYAATHTIEGQKYLLAQEITQSYQLANVSTYVELTGELPEETAPAQQATPLLYKVTGSEGQEMYLMGTIHVGDAKTGFLPQEVYDAFNASDALAVEADILTFEDKIASDPQLAAQIAAAYANTSGTTMQELLGEELYATALKLLQASGNYTSNMEAMKPFVWESTISSFYLTMGRLRSELGMDMRLLKLANEQNKKVLEVESALFQYEMLAGFSPELQKLQLEDTLTCNVTEYCNDAQELYDLWCAGDEAALREMLNEDPGTMTEDEQALYQEYTDAMIIDRNKGMLNVAISYLEGEQTVFYAVGLAHLLQENGLVDTLREAGYTVEQVIYS